MFRFLNLPNALTALGSAIAMAAVVLAMDGRVHAALGAFLFAAFCDLLDGPLARRRAAARGVRPGEPAEPAEIQERRFGASLDIAADACSFGLAPALLLVAAGLRSPWEIAGAVALLLAAVWRLAWFATTGLETDDASGGAKFYIGLPTTYVGLLLPLAGLADLWRPEALHPTLAATAWMLAVLMVSPLRIRKPHGPWYPVLILLGLAVLAGHVVAAGK